MTTAGEKEANKIKRVAATYNMIPNLVWTVLFLSPVAIFCYRFVNQQSIYILLGISLIPAFFPNSFYDNIQLSRNPKFYKRFGVQFINKFAQNGSLLNKYVRKKYPGLKSLPVNKLPGEKQFSRTYFFEKFHFSMFIFFGAVTVYALVKDYLLWAFIISICNLFYNIYPNLLQQYIRLRLSSVRKRS